MLGSEAVTATAPAPANFQAAAPPVSADQATAPVSAAEASGSTQAPPVNTASSGTVTMNIGMTLYGSDVQPFTSEVQFHTASAMAGVRSAPLISYLLYFVFICSKSAAQSSYVEKFMKQTSKSCF